MGRIAARGAFGLTTIAGFGTLILLPFVWRDLPALFSEDGRSVLLLLLSTGLIHLTAALFLLESLKRGKISVVEPIWSFEIPAAALLAFFFLGERLTDVQIGLIALLMAGLFLVSLRGKDLTHRLFLERGVFFAFIGAVTIGTAAFLTGWSARLADPLMANFAVNVVLLLASGIYLASRGELRKPFKDLARKSLTLLPMVILDNTAWIAYAFALSLISIGIATALSESYIIIAVILGLALNRERLDIHQKLGLIVAVASAISLAAIST